MQPSQYAVALVASMVGGTMLRAYRSAVFQTSITQVGGPGLTPLPRAEYDFGENLREARHQSTASASGITVVELPKIVMWLDSGAPPNNYIF